MPATASELVELLELEDLGEQTYLGRQPTTSRARVFGGQVAAQACKAAALSIDPEFGMHSLHSYFLLPGDPSVPILYEVQNLRDGRSFATRRVAAIQHGRPIYFLTASFQRSEPGLEHSEPMPACPGPEAGIDLIELVRQRRPEMVEHWQREWSAVEVRHLGTSAEGLTPDPDHPAQARLWMRVGGDLGDDPIQHRASFVYASDMTLLGSALVPHGLTLADPRLVAASLDHTIWFHRPFRADSWWLYDQNSPSAQSGRALALGRVFDEQGVLVATVAQEGMVRVRRDPPGA